MFDNFLHKQIIIILFSSATGADSTVLITVCLFACEKFFKKWQSFCEIWGIGTALPPEDNI